jgi:hypothetical protein
MDEQLSFSLELKRRFTEKPDDTEAQLALHKERAKMVHGMADALGIEVRDPPSSSIGSHPVDGPPHEWVEAIVILTPVLLSVALAVWKYWVADGKVIGEAKITKEGKDGTKTTIDLKDASEDSVLKFLKAASPA